MMRRMKGDSRALLCAFATGLLLFSTLTLAQSKLRPADVYMYGGPDRDRRVIDGARREGMVVVYTSLNLKDSVPIT